MPSRILLISVNRCIQPYPVYPLGISHVAAAVRNAGHTVKILDVNVDGNQFTDSIREFNPDIVGLSLRNIDDVAIDVQKYFVPDLLEVAELVKKTTPAPIVLGGSAFSLFPIQLMKLSKADFGIIGEGEVSIISLIDAITAKKPLKNIPGLVYSNSGKIIINNRATMPAAAIPKPLRPNHLVEYYKAKSLMLNIQTQRGCSCDCCYCTYPVIEGCSCRYRSTADVVDEIEEIQSAGLHYFFIVDSAFNISNSHVASICEEMLRRNLSISWGCLLRPQGLTNDLVALMAKAGLRHIEFGSDSFCDPVLEAYGKNFTFDDIYQSSELARKYKVRYAHFLISGGPSETEATLQQGFLNSKRLSRTIIFPFIGMRIYPQTPLEQTALLEKVISKDTDLITPVFYISPALTKNKIVDLLNSFKAESKNWVFGEPDAALEKVMNDLRGIGTIGPLWEFLIK